jgi:predicted RNA-binding Zn ribbon-like protein
MTTKFVFVANLPCLDFINTQMIQGGRMVDFLETFSDLVSWLMQADALSRMEADEAVKRWGGHREGMRVLEQARELRSSLRETAERLVNGRAVAQSTVETINALLRQRVGHAQLVRVRGGFAKRFHAKLEAVIHLLIPLAEFASDLLCRDDLSLVKKCQNPACILYFYDTTKNHARRWCSMKICGNRIKVAAHHRRYRANPTTREAERAARS